MTELIVALDGPEPVRLALRLAEVGVTWYKVGPRTLVDRNWQDLLGPLFAPGVNVFLDLKLADIADTCQEAALAWARRGVAALSTFTDRATLAALRGAQGTAMRVWRVGQLTDERTGVAVPWIARDCHGLIIPGSRITDQVREIMRGKDIVTPGVRLDDTEGANIHMWRTSAHHCAQLGITHAVVGRPIADDPVAATRAYMEALR